VVSYASLRQLTEREAPQGHAAAQSALVTIRYERAGGCYPLMNSLQGVLSARSLWHINAL
jgi:hypothetical protein